MEDIQIRYTILHYLKLYYNDSPHGFLDKEDLIKKLKISDNELDRNIKYLENKGLIEVQWFHGGEFMSNISSTGIDEIEFSENNPDSPSTYLPPLNTFIDNKKKPQQYVRIPDDITDKEILIYIKDDILSKTKILKTNGYVFSVFISHSFQDLIFISKLCDELIDNNILPKLWFQKISSKGVREKLCDMIDSSDLLLIYYSENSLLSQMTNNEIGFIEGKRYFTKKYRGYNPELIYKIRDESLNINDLNGFFTKGDEIFPIENEKYDMKRLIDELIKQYENNIKIIDEESPFSIKELLNFALLKTLRKMAKPTPIKGYKRIEELRKALLKYGVYSHDDYINNMEIKELKKICEHFKEPISGKRLELILRIKKHIEV